MQHPDDDAEREADQGGVERLQRVRPDAPACVAQREHDLARPRQDDVLDPEGEAEQLPRQEEADDERAEAKRRRSCGFMQPLSLAGRAATINSRSRWVSATNVGLVGSSSIVRGRGNGTTLSSMMRPGRACITQMRLAR